MRIRYNKLWKLLSDKGMTKTELKDAAGISATSIAKLGKGGKSIGAWHYKKYINIMRDSLYFL